MNLFITGTGTNVGKTYVTKLLIESMREEGLDAVGFKPISCGDRQDAYLLAEASGGQLSLDEINPVHFHSPTAPYVATMLENRTLEPQVLIDAYQALSAKHQSVLVEGAGGWEVPLAPNYRISDLAKDLNLPVLLVVGNRLGALSDAILTIEAIRNKGLNCIGIILNQLEDEMDTAMITNKGVIEDLTGLPLLDHVIFGQDFLTSDFFLKV